MNHHRNGIANGPAAPASTAGPAKQRVTALLRAWWSAKTPRERTLLGIAFTLLAVFVIWSFGVRPALDTIARSHDTLPRLRAEAIQIDAYILEARALERRRTGQIDPATLSDSLNEDLHRAGLGNHASSSATAIPSVGSEGWEITLTDAPASAVFDWLAGLPYRLQLQVHSIDLHRSRIDGRDRPGHVSGHVVVLAPGERRP